MCINNMYDIFQVWTNKIGAPKPILGPACPHATCANRKNKQCIALHEVAGEPFNYIYIFLLYTTITTL